MATTEYEAVPEIAAEETPERPGTVVMKFGGTSVAGVERLRAVAKRIVAAREAGNRVVAVLSAMGDMTDEWVRLAHEMSPHPRPREVDMLISVGERISCALCAIAIHDLGHEAISLTGSQAGIVTDTAHGKAKIVEIRARRIHEALDAEKIVLVAGFQGVSTDYDITTLGRGGSDTTAVALAAALGAEACEIYTDVDGVHHRRPAARRRTRASCTPSATTRCSRWRPSARKVLQLRSVELARNHDVKLHVRSTLLATRAAPGFGEEDERMLEKAMISGVTHTIEETCLPGRGRPGRRALLRRSPRPGVNVDTIVQTGSEIVFSAADAEDRERDAACSTSSARRGSRTRRARQGERRRRRNEEPPGRRGEDVRDARRARDRAADRDDVADQDRLLRRRETRSSAPSRRCTTHSSSTSRAGGARACLATRASASSARPAPSATVTLALLAERGYEHVRAFASARSAGRRLPYGVGELVVEEATPEALGAGDLDVCFFSVGTSASRELVPACRRGRRRLRRQVVGVPADRRHPARRPRGERRPRARRTRASSPTRTARRSSSSASLKPLHEAAGLEARPGRDVPVGVRRRRQADGRASGRSSARSGDLVMDWDFDGDEFDEESKLRAETRKILELPELPLSATCVRVPVLVGHAQASGSRRSDHSRPTRRARRCCRGPLGVRLAESPDRRRRRRAATTSSSAGSAATRPAETARPLGRVRQPPQGRGAERDPDRRAPPRAQALAA